jgi:glycerophosphoryl diester phosphodiesterase
MGAPYLELDVWMTRDGAVVVIHDQTVDRTTEGSGSVEGMNLSELQRLDAGYRFCRQGEGTFPFRGQGIRVPTLEEVLVAFPQALLNIEVKQNAPPLDEAVEAVLTKTGALDRVLLASERGEILERARRRFGTRVATGISQEEGIRFAQWLLSGRRGEMRLEGQALQVPETLDGKEYISADLIGAAHELGMEVHVWTVNDPSRMKSFLEMGADGIMTDFPDRFPRE